MKTCFMLLIGLFSLPAFAHQVEWVRHSQHGVEQILLRLEGDGKTNRLYTNTNYFDAGYPARIGLFERKTGGDSRTTLLQIAAQAKSFSSLKASPASPHIAKIFFDSELVPTGSEPYLQLERVIRNEMKTSGWTYLDGDEVRFLNSSNLAVETWKTKKPLYKKRFPASAVCRSKAGEDVCTLPTGYIYMPAGFRQKILKEKVKRKQ